MKLPPLLAFALLAWASAGAAEPTRKPNVLFLVVDDLNAWIGPLGVHRLVQTPHLDRLAQRGTVMLQAQCQAPLCNPSRTSVMLGLRPSTTGVYALAPWFRNVPALRDRVTLPQHFKASGYTTLSTGKVYHGAPPRPQRTKEFDVWNETGGVGARPPAKLIPPTPMGNHPLMDWGAFPHRDEDKGDYRVASWVIDQLGSLPADRPFFLAAGFFLPHVPCYTTPEWLALYPDDDRVLPAFLRRDRDDTPRFSWYLHWSLPEPRLKWVEENGQWRNLVRSYLACTSFVDAQIGRVLAALAASPHADNTLIVVWGDNGYHLGEKLITGKNTLWDPSTHVPLLFAGPGVARGGRVAQPVELLDLYPTLIDLCGLPRRDDLEGLSLAPQLRDAQAPRARPALTTHNPGNHAVRSDRWRYIRYADGSEELYDLRQDPHEWNNLAARPEHAPVIAEHRRWLPATDAPPAPGSANRLLTYDPKTDEARWEGTVVRRTDAIPE